jgi:hypothetical protein
MVGEIIGENPPYELQSVLALAQNLAPGPNPDPQVAAIRVKEKAPGLSCRLNPALDLALDRDPDDHECPSGRRLVESWVFGDRSRVVPDLVGLDATDVDGRRFTSTMRCSREFSWSPRLVRRRSTELSVARSNSIHAELSTSITRSRRERCVRNLADCVSPTHGENLRLGHRYDRKAAQSKVNCVCLRAYAEALHDRLDVAVLNPDSGSSPTHISFLHACVGNAVPVRRSGS